MGCIGVTTVSLMVYHLLHKKRLVSFIFLGLENIGKASLEIYALSVSLLSGLLPSIAKIVFSKLIIMPPPMFYDFVLTPIIAIVYSIGLYWLVKILYRLRIGKYIFGERNNIISKNNV